MFYPLIVGKLLWDCPLDLCFNCNELRLTWAGQLLNDINLLTLGYCSLPAIHFTLSRNNPFNAPVNIFPHFFYVGDGNVPLTLSLGLLTVRIIIFLLFFLIQLNVQQSNLLGDCFCCRHWLKDLQWLVAWERYNLSLYLYARGYLSVSSTSARLDINKKFSDTIIVIMF